MFGQTEHLSHGFWAPKTAQFWKQRLHDRGTREYGIYLIPALLLVLWIGAMSGSAVSDQTILWDVREHRQDTNVDRGIGLCARRNHRNEAVNVCLSLHFATDSIAGFSIERAYSDATKLPVCRISASTRASSARGTGLVSTRVTPTVAARAARDAPP